jgi:hypothetical protein
MVNQEDLTAERVEKWVAQLRAEGFLQGGNAASASSSSPGATEPEFVFQVIEQHSNMLDETIKEHGSTGFTPYYNAKNKSTMWVSADGRSCYYTADVQSDYSP